MKNKSNNLDKVLKMFGFMWVLTAIGVFLGQYVPIGITIVLAIVALVLVIVMNFITKNKTFCKIAGYLVSLIIGITLYATLGFYVGELGISIVIAVVISCTIVFGLLGLFGYKLHKDLENWGVILLIALVALVIFSIVSIFVGFSSLIMVIVSGIGIMIFVGFTIYDFNQIAKKGVADEEIPLVALNLYLDLLNLILQVLKLIYNLKNLLDD